jgi:hypothetical protein
MCALTETLHPVFFLHFVDSFPLYGPNLQNFPPKRMAGGAQKTKKGKLFLHFVRLTLSLPANNRYKQ